MVRDLFNRLCFLIDEVERLDKESSVPEGEHDPALDPLLDEASAIVRQLDPIYREGCRNQPEKLAEWESIMNAYPDVLAEDEEARAKAEAEAAKEAEVLKLAADVRAGLDRINADLDQLMAMEGPDLEFEAVAERVMAGIHELDDEIRLRCRDYPEQLEKWNDTMERFADVEAIFEGGRELEDSEPAN
jgi:hypothetical protein